MRVHVINLRSRADRRAQFSNWNARPGLELVFVDAAIGVDIDPESAVRDGLVAARTRLTPGALGCAQSHRELWRQVVARGETAIVCEDDGCLRGDFTVRAGELMTSLGDEWDLLYLGYNTDALVAAETPEGLKLLLQFDDAAKRAPGFLMRSARCARVRPRRLPASKPGAPFVTRSRRVARRDCWRRVSRSRLNAKSSCSGKTAPSLPTGSTA
ncbi:MAG: hypothetical protein DCF16_01105 [Alphaproteobacteria bacterium]|nr:MAG: hypothetical protein DCF16_01105 [Alphaproteobacteria bacterium]